MPECSGYLNSCISDSLGSGSEKILFTLEALFWDEKFSKSVHISDDSTAVKSDVTSDVNSALNSEIIVTEKMNVVSLLFERTLK